MLVTEYAKFGNGHNQTYVIDEPDECPLCHFSIKPVKLHVHPYYRESDRYISCLYLCNRCNRPFVALFECTNRTVKFEENNYLRADLEYLGPKHFLAKTFDQQISDLSPQFVKIFNQAAAAESQELDEIAGIGYRKAIEFLVKDFAIHLHPEDPDAIKRKPLARCIEEYIDNPQIKLLASRAVWIGNDETHYIRKQEDRDIEDMKKFINAMVYFVGMYLIAEDAASISPA